MAEDVQRIKEKLEKLRWEWREGAWTEEEMKEQENWTRDYEHLDRVDLEREWMNYGDERNPTAAESTIHEEEEGDPHEREEIEDEYKLKFEDLFPLIFIGTANRLPVNPFPDDNSLSYFSIEDLDIQEVFSTRKAHGNSTRRDNKVSSAKLDPGLIAEEDEEGKQGEPDLMTYVSRLQANFRKIQSVLFGQPTKLVVKFESFPWNTKGQKYSELQGLTLEERVRALGNDGTTEGVLLRNELLDVRKFLTQVDPWVEENRWYRPPHFIEPVTSVIKNKSHGIDISEIYIRQIQLDLLKARDTLKDKKAADRLTFLSLLGRLDTMFVETHTNMTFQNEVIFDDNYELESRNQALLAHLKVLNKQATEAEKQRLTLAKTLASTRMQRDALAREESVYIRGQELKAKVEEERLNLKEAERMEALLKKNLKEKKQMNSRLKKTLDALTKNMQSHHTKLQGVVKAYDKVNSLSEVLDLRMTSDGKSLSHKKLLYRNRSGLSKTTLQKMEEENLEEHMNLGLVQDRVHATRHKMMEAESNLEPTKIRPGFKLGELKPVKSSLWADDPVVKNKLKTAIEQTLKEAEDEYKMKQTVTEDGDSPPQPLIKHSRSLSPLSRPDFSQYTHNIIHNYPTVTSNIVNQPSTLDESLLRKEILSGSKKCHPPLARKPSVPRVKIIPK